MEKKIMKNMTGFNSYYYYYYYSSPITDNVSGLLAFAS